MEWITLFNKEMLEHWRNFKWIWVPLVLILLAIMDPITTYYLPVILENVGGLPEGAMFEIPELLPVEALMMSLAQLSSLGVLVIVLMSMGTIAGERKSGVAELILVKPIRYLNYITAKWSALLLIVWVSLTLALSTSWYYINLLFGELSFTDLLLTIFFYGLWFSFVITLVIFFSVISRSPGLVAAFTIITTIAMSIITSLFGKHLTWSPSNMSGHIEYAIVSQELTKDLMMTGLITLILIGILIVGAQQIFIRKEQIN